MKCNEAKCNEVKWQQSSINQSINQSINEAINQHQHQRIRIEIGYLDVVVVGDAAAAIR
jgi:hypothetical protein